MENKHPVRIPRSVVAGVILTTGLLGAGVLAAGYGGPGTARGTSEALGYPTNTSVPIATMPPAAPTDTATAVPPTIAATSTFVPPTAVPPAATQAPPTSTTSPVPPSPTPMPPTATATSTPAKAPVTIQLGAKSVARGDILSLQVHTLPGLAVRAVLRYPSLGLRTVLNGRAGRQGIAKFKITVAQGPAKGKNSLGAIVMVTASDSSHKGSGTAAFTVYQPVRLRVGAKVITRHGTQHLVVSVAVARAAVIDIGVTLSNGGHGTIPAHGKVVKGGTIPVRITLPKLSGTATARITVTVQTREGVRETSKLSLVVHR
ncbi:MAG: hypothetical protein ACRDG4_02550 [Chloroflexota bacterium]